jgi:hypothetical protein
VAYGPLQVLIGLAKCDDWLGRDPMERLLKQAGLADEVTVDMLDRVDQLRRRRPRQRRTP